MRPTRADVAVVAARPLEVGPSIFAISQQWQHPTNGKLIYAQQQSKKLLEKWSKATQALGLHLSGQACNMWHLQAGCSSHNLVWVVCLVPGRLIECHER
jgi:hypothetical protein